MITAVDSSVLLDVFGADPKFGPSSAAALRNCLGEGRVVACEVVWAETSASFSAAADADAALRGLRVDFSALDAPAALVADGLKFDSCEITALISAGSTP